MQCRGLFRIGRCLSCCSTQNVVEKRELTVCDAWCFDSRDVIQWKRVDKDVDGFTVNGVQYTLNWFASVYC